MAMPNVMLGLRGVREQDTSDADSATVATAPAPQPFEDIGRPQQLRELTTPPTTPGSTPENSTLAQTSADILSRRLGTASDQLYTTAAQEQQRAGNLNWLRSEGQANQAAGLSYSGGSSAFAGGTPYDQFFREAGEKYNLNPGLLAGLADAESGFRNLGANKAGAIGIMQVVPNDRTRKENPNLLDPRSNIMAGAGELAAYLYDPRYKWANNNLFNSLWSYNAGYTGAQRGYKTGYGGNYQGVVQERARKYGYSGAYGYQGTPATVQQTIMGQGNNVYPRHRDGTAGNADAARNFIKTNWGFDSAGYADPRRGGHVPNSQHYTGLALDVNVPGNDGERRGDDPKAAMIRDWFMQSVQNGNPFGVRQMIYNGKIWTLGDSRGWHAYTGSNNHAGHIHIGFNDTGGKVGNVPGGQFNSAGYSGPADFDVNAANASAAGAQTAADTYARKAQLLSRLGGMSIFSGNWL